MGRMSSNIFLEVENLLDELEKGSINSIHIWHFFPLVFVSRFLILSKEKNTGWIHKTELITIIVYYSRNDIKFALKLQTKRKQIIAFNWI